MSFTFDSEPQIPLTFLQLLVLIFLSSRPQIEPDLNLTFECVYQPITKLHVTIASGKTGNKTLASNQEKDVSAFFSIQHEPQKLLDNSKTSSKLKFIKKFIKPTAKSFLSGDSIDFKNREHFVWISAEVFTKKRIDFNIGFYGTVFFKNI